MSATSKVHQELSGFIYNELCNHLKGRKCKVYSAPFDVRLYPKSKDD